MLILSATQVNAQAKQQTDTTAKEQRYIVKGDVTAFETLLKALNKQKELEAKVDKAFDILMQIKADKEENDKMIDALQNWIYKQVSEQIQVKQPAKK